ncbi:siroheme decarboxylase subunit beta [Pseudothauera rhizosphaerae]|uniref:siroheme decarboxylase n=1 Tax=Pseudothauera rhizosphaerae TaxID=2565932 RepID=A0A4S4ADQ4_9RHOO|nr:AsnC family transcriptional regulator [Pseudothauera rhizosphaerae]THF57224.1 Lrp/AsnC family transcriptional regulator [Pseudothauera rhizosphaerae]
MNAPHAPLLDDIDRRLIRATQAGLPLLPKPYESLAARVGIPEAEVIRRLAAMLDGGVIRRIGAVPNHYALGYTANGMSVWDVDDAAIDAAGERVGAQPFVTHCYRRPRRPPEWPYNLFAMVHGVSREEVLARVGELQALLTVEFPRALRDHEVLFSTAILKKTGLRLRD